MEVFGVRLVGFTAENAWKLGLTLLFVSVILALRWALMRLLRRAAVRHRTERVVFWSRQGISLAAAFLILVSLLSIWFDDPGRLATGLGLVSAGLAFALQKVVTSFAGYLVVMRGRTFTVGDRISLGGVRGDVLKLGFIQTTIMEMGLPPNITEADSSAWVSARQFTGRIVSVTNDQVFAEPVFNYTREFPFIWEELRVPIRYEADRAAAERIILEAVTAHTEDIRQLTRESLDLMERKYLLRVRDMVPRVFFRITDNWLELSARFLVREHGIREAKDAMTRQVLAGFDAAGIGVASATFDLVGAPRLRLELARPDGEGPSGPGP